MIEIIDKLPKCPYCKKEFLNLEVHLKVNKNCKCEHEEKLGINKFYIYELIDLDREEGKEVIYMLEDTKPRMLSIRSKVERTEGK